MITGFNTDIRVGTVLVQRVPELRILSQRNALLTRMTIALPDPVGDIFQALDDRAPVKITLGYRDQIPASWSGTLAGMTVATNKDQLILKAIGRERPLVEAMITQSFYQETPEAIIRYAVEQAGFVTGNIHSPGVTFPRFTASCIPVWQVARQCEHTLKRAFGFDMAPWALWMGTDGKINWGPENEPGNIPVIDSNANLIRHSPGGNHSELSRIETFMMPSLMHSQVVRLKDLKRGVEGDLKVLKVEHVLKDSQARTFISYGESYERY